MRWRRVERLFLDRGEVGSPGDIDHEGVIRHKSHGNGAMDDVLKECVARAEQAVRAK